MTDRNIRQADDAERARKDWSAPRVRGVVPSRGTRGGSGEQNGNVDDVTYDLS